MDGTFLGYREREDVSEKIFRGDKSYLGNKGIRIHTVERAAAKIFVGFVALIIRYRIYTLLRREKERLDKEPNFMTVPVAI